MSNIGKTGFLSFRRNVSQVTLVGEGFFRSVGTFGVFFTDPKRNKPDGNGSSRLKKSGLQCTAGLQ